MGWITRILISFLLGQTGLVLGLRPAYAQGVPCEKYKLNNGLTVILHEDHSLPKVALDLWYRVGSRDELAGRSGFAHLFEHLMFKGTRRAPANIFKRIEGNGGSCNGYTTEDRTVYISGGPPELLPLLLWLEADRIEQLGGILDEEKLGRERDVVRNERRSGYDNQPYGRVELRLPELMYPPDHPYGHPVIGYHQDLIAATLPEAKDFFATYYVPSNLSMCIAGDFDSAKVKAQIAELFGTLPRAPRPGQRTKAVPPLDRVVRATLLDRVNLTKVVMAFHAPARFTPGEAEMQLAAAILGTGQASRLYKRLVMQDKLAISVGVWQECRQLGSSFEIEAMLPPGGNPDAYEKAVDEELAEFVRTGPTEEELARHKAMHELNMLEQMADIEEKAHYLNLYDFYYGEPNSFNRDLDRYRQATADGLREWARKTLTLDARVILRVIPEEPTQKDSPREHRPELLSESEFSPSMPESFTLGKGIPVLLWRKPELPMVAAMVLVRTGGPTECTRAGLIPLTATMLGEGAGDRDATQFSAAMQQLGAEFHTGASTQSVRASVKVIKRNFELAMQLVADAVRRARFQTDDWERVKRVRLGELKRQEVQPGSMAYRAAQRLFFKDTNPYSMPYWGTTETVSALGLEDVKREYASIVRPERVAILIAGDTTVAEARPVLDRLFGQWPAEPAQPRPKPDLGLRSRDRLQLAIVDRPDAVQTCLVLLAPGPAGTDPRRPHYQLLNTAFGGCFTSRLNLNLREEHGYTYGAHSWLEMEPELGWVSVSSQVQSSATGDAVRQTLHEIQHLRKGTLAPEELDKARRALRLESLETFQSLNRLLDQAAERIEWGLAFQTVADDLATQRGATVADLNELAGQTLPLDQAVLVLVGDKKIILEQIKDLGLTAPIELHAPNEPATQPAS